MTSPPPLTVVARGGAYAVVDKPAGLLSVPGRGPGKEDCVAARVRVTFPSADGPVTIHRLDMETSGLMVVALAADAHRALSIQFQERAVEKRYEAVVEGAVEGESGAIDLPMRLDVNNRPLQIIDHEQGKPAHTRWRVLTRTTRIGHEPRGDAPRTRLELTPLTGRSHQLRLHCAAGLGRPIVGDSLYGSSQGEQRMLLHATRLAFTDPETGRRVECASPAPF